MKDQKDGPEVVAATHLSVGDGGFTMRVLDDRGPTLEFVTSHFGNIPMTLKVFTNTKGLEAMRDVINKALAHQFQTKEYVYPARPVK